MALIQGKPFKQIIMKHFTLLVLSFFFVGATQAQLVDPSFEAAGEGGVWEQASTNFGTPLCTQAFCGTCGGPCVAYAGEWYAWFGGATAVETGVLAQTFTLPAGSTAELKFWFKVALAGPALEADWVNVKMDGDIYWSANGTQGTEFAEYTLVTVDISALADGGSHTLSIEGYQTTAESVNFLVDAFSVTVDGTEATNINDQLNHEATVVVYPNPASDIINLQFGVAAEGVATVAIYNVAGQIVLQESISNINNALYTLDTSILDAGMYVVSVENGTERFQERVLVTK